MSKLNNIRHEWDNTEAKMSEFITPEDGDYRAMLESVTYSERDNDGNETDPTFVLVFCIAEGDKAGQKFRRFSTLRNANAISYFKGDVVKMGLSLPRDPEELPGLLQKAVGIVLDLTVRTKLVNGRAYKDIYINRFVKRAQPAPQAIPPHPAPQIVPRNPPMVPQSFYQDDNIPF